MLTSEGMVACMTIPGEVFATLVTYILDFNPQSLGRIVFTSVASVDYVWTPLIWVFVKSTNSYATIPLQGLPNPIIGWGEFKSPGIYLAILINNVLLRHLDIAGQYCAVSYLL